MTNRRFTIASRSLQDNFGYDLPAVEAAKKKHDAIETDIAAYEERVQALVDISGELEAERYHDAKRVDARKDNVLRLWDYLQELLRARRGRLDKNLTLQWIFQEMLYIISWMDDMKVLSDGSLYHATVRTGGVGVAGGKWASPKKAACLSLAPSHQYRLTVLSYNNTWAARGKLASS